MHVKLIWIILCDNLLTIYNSPAAIGASYCPWGGQTDWNACSIHGEVHLASHYRAMLRLWNFYHFWHLASYTGNLATLENLSRGGLPSFYNFWQVAKISWHGAKGTPPDPPWSWTIPCTHSPCDQNRPRKCIFLWISDLDLWPLTPIFQKLAGGHHDTSTYQKSCPLVHRLLQDRWQHTEGRKEGMKARKYIDSPRNERATFVTNTYF